MPLSPGRARRGSRESWRLASRASARRRAGCWAGRSRRRRASASPPNRLADDVVARRLVGGGGEGARSARRGRRSCSLASCSYSGRKAGPHWEMQCASSTANMRDRQPGERREHAARSSAARATCRAGRPRPPDAAPGRHVVGRVREELMVSAATPASFSAATWSCISATSGETTTVRPPLTRAGTWKQSDLPEPVGITASTWRPASRPSTTCSWPGRKRSKPKVSWRTRCLASVTGGAVTGKEAMAGTIGDDRGAARTGRRGLWMAGLVVVLCSAACRGT